MGAPLRDYGGTQRVVDVLAGMEKHMRNVPGFRRGHARGIAFRGTFRATPEVAALTTAEMLQGAPVDVVVRLSNGGASPYLPDRAAANRGNTLGIGVRFELPSGGHSMWTALSVTAFPARNAEDFVALTAAQRPEPPTMLPNPLRFLRFVATRPHCAPGVVAAGTLKPTKSFATTRFNGLHAYHLVDAEGRRRAFRARWMPVAGVQDMDPADDVALPPQYLVDDIRRRVAAGPVRWRLVLQMAAEGDPTDDLTKQWPETRPQLVAGEVVIDRLHEDPDLVEGWCFDPTLMPPGIELSDDPVLHLRSEVYWESHRRRTSETRPAIRPE